ncbi:hypothetical protein [Luteimonas huabeiensis]|uniref:hypothetical protein n=1 Tax=Luteimonas huabeiensis TaxID=1244513 RepID=UPI000465B733|nr:hypothetical protein [Luteimonas huabeiensis]
MIPSPHLYLVHLETDARPDGTDPLGWVELAPGLYLAESGLDRSRLYHAIKRRYAPQRLLVAPLAAAPKFKGMAPGALKWLRARGHA